MSLAASHVVTRRSKAARAGVSRKERAHACTRTVLAVRIVSGKRMRLRYARAVLDVGDGLAAGSIDVVVEAGLKPYDIVALIPIIERAGGVITTVEGGPAEKGCDIVAAATPELHAAAMAALRG